MKTVSPQPGTNQEQFPNEPFNHDQSDIPGITLEDVDMPEIPTVPDFDLENQAKLYPSAKIATMLLLKSCTLIFHQLLSITAVSMNVLYIEIQMQVSMKALRCARLAKSQDITQMEKHQGRNSNTSLL